MRVCYAKLRVELHEALGGAPLHGAMVVLGSAAMQLHGIDREIRDIDLFARPWAWEALKGTGRWNVVPDLDPPPVLQWDGCAIPVHCWQESYTPNYSGNLGAGDLVDQVFAQAHIVNGWPVMDMGQLMDWKLEADRPKDRLDVDLIAGWFAVNEQTGVAR